MLTAHLIEILRPMLFVQVHIEHTRHCTANNTLDDGLFESDRFGGTFNFLWTMQDTRETAMQ